MKRMALAIENLCGRWKKILMLLKDDLTVEFKLPPQVFAPFDANLGSLRPIPKHIFEGEKDLAKIREK